jgi:hypothetical protein
LKRERIIHLPFDDSCGSEGSVVLENESDDDSTLNPVVEVQETGRGSLERLCCLPSVRRRSEAILRSEEAMEIGGGERFKEFQGTFTEDDLVAMDKDSNGKISSSDIRLMLEERLLKVLHNRPSFHRETRARQMKEEAKAKSLAVEMAEKVMSQFGESSNCLINLDLTLRKSAF